MKIEYLKENIANNFEVRGELIETIVTEVDLWRMPMGDALNRLANWLYDKDWANNKNDAKELAEWLGTKYKFIKKMAEIDSFERE